MAIALLGVMASGIFGSFRYGFFALQLVRENQRATQILLEKVETLRLYSWDQVNTPGFIPTNLPTEYYDPQAPTGQTRGCLLRDGYSSRQRPLHHQLQHQLAQDHGHPDLDHPRHPAHAQPDHLYRQRRPPELCLLGSHRRARQAWTLVEMMVAVGVFSLCGIGLMGIYLFSVKSMASMYNYCLLDQYNRQAMDQLTREIRQATKVLNYTTNSITILAASDDGSTSIVTY